MPTLEDFAPHRLQRTRLHRELRQAYRSFLAHRASHAGSHDPPCIDCLALWRRMSGLAKLLGGPQKTR